jgi:AbrB family looped-hinge helix DNA binding protein
MLEQEIVLSDIKMTIGWIGKVNSGGRITIPSEFREKLSITEDTKIVVYYSEEDKSLYVKVMG